jgi:hypothetical protein
MTPLIPGFRATTKLKAFALNALVSAIVIVLTIQVKSSLDAYFGKDKDKHLPVVKTSFMSLSLTFVVCFVAAFVSYGLMFVVFGYGGGMLVEGA